MIDTLPTIQTPADVEAELPVVLSWARNLAIAGPGDFNDAGERLKSIKGLAKRVGDFFSPMKKNADAAKKAILDAERKITAPLDEAEGLVKRAMLTFQQEQQRKAQEEQRRLQAIADEKARKEREKAEQEVAKQRQIEAEARTQAEAARKAAAEEASSAERRKLLAEAGAAERKANAAAVKVEAKTEQAAAVVAPVVHVPVAAPKVGGVTTKKVWKFRITDESLVPREYLVVDEKKLGVFARGMKDGMKIPGVEFYYEETLSSGRY